MSNRTPSFVVVGLVIIMILLGFFYMSCSSTTTELRQALGDFEERIRMLTMKNSENEKRIEAYNTKKLELEEEKRNIEKQMEKKDSEINDLNAKLNEKIAEVESLKSDNKALEEQLKEFKNMSDTLVSKNSVIEKIRQEYDEQKKSNDIQLNDIKQQLNQSQEKLSIISKQRLQPVLSQNETILTNNKQKVDQNVPSQGQNNSDGHQRLHRSLNESLFDNKLLKDTNINNVENAQKTVNLTSILYLNETNTGNNQSQLALDIQNNHQELQLNKNNNKKNNQEEVNVNNKV